MVDMVKPAPTDSTKCDRPFFSFHGAVSPQGVESLLPMSLQLTT
jgi:hypothetical protein